MAVTEKEALYNSVSALAIKVNLGKFQVNLCSERLTF